MGRAGANGFTRSVLAAAIALAALLALSIGAARASAEPLTMEFTEAFANVGSQLDDDPLFGPPSVAPLSAQIDPETGEISAGILAVPPFSTFIEEPIESNVLVDFDIGVVSGSFDPATGALILSGTAEGTLKASGGLVDGTCEVAAVSDGPDPEILTLSTAGSSGGATNPRSGVPFTAGLAGPGAIAGEWIDMVATPETPADEAFCDDVEAEIGGEGGVWLQHAGDVVPPAAPQLTGTDPASPNPSGTPRIRGAAEAGSTVRVYAGEGCTGAPVVTGSAAELAAPGLRVDVAEGATATFSATATDPVGNTSPCSASISYTRTKTPPPPPPVVECVVPKLKGKTLKQAKTALKRANCKLGKVTKPKPNGKKGKKGKRKQPVLVVKSSTPRPGAKPANGRVDLKLGPKPKPKKKKARG